MRPIHLLLALALPTLITAPVRTNDTSLWTVYESTPRQAKYVDLTHAITPEGSVIFVRSGWSKDGPRPPWPRGTSPCASTPRRACGFDRDPERTTPRRPSRGKTRRAIARAHLEATPPNLPFVYFQGTGVRGPLAPAGGGAEPHGRETRRVVVEAL
jgi:hypothetical protein